MLFAAHAFAEFEKDDDARVAVLCGGGGVFCAGADLKALSKLDGGNTQQFSTLVDQQAQSIAAGSSSSNTSTSYVNPMTPPIDGGIGPMGPSRMFLSKPVIAAIRYAVWEDLLV